MGETLTLLGALRLRLKSADALGGSFRHHVEAMADVLGGLWGGRAIQMLDALGGKSFAAPVRKGAAWDPHKHPRDRRGRFIPAHSGAAYAAVQAKVKDALKGEATPEKLGELVQHLNILTTKQLHELKKEFGLKASGRVKAELVARLADRLHRGRREGGEGRPGEAPGGNAPEGEATPTPKPAPKRPTARLGVGAETPAPDHHAAVLAGLDAALGGHQHLDPGLRAHYRRVAGAVVARMTPAAAARLRDHVSGYEFHDSLESLTDSLAARSIKVAVVKSQGQQIGGAYRPSTGRLALDGGEVEVGKGRKAPTSGIYAHEMGHAIDGRRGARISDGKEWREAWEAELHDGRISTYAGTSAAEGFAEFSRLVHDTKLSADVIAKEFPRCAAVWRKEGLL